MFSSVELCKNIQKKEAHAYSLINYSEKMLTEVLGSMNLNTQELSLADTLKEFIHRVLGIKKGISRLSAGNSIEDRYKVVIN